MKGADREMKARNASVGVEMNIDNIEGKLNITIFTDSFLTE